MSTEDVPDDSVCTYCGYPDCRCDDPDDDEPVVGVDICEHGLGFDEQCDDCEEEEDDSPSVIGTDLAPMPTQEEYRAAHKSEYVRLFVEVGLDPETPAAWHDEQWEDIKDMTPQEAFDAEVEYWDGE